jgi:beta-phosphoglucomutase-like phosphatase (HAD superfamily)
VIRSGSAALGPGVGDALVLATLREPADQVFEVTAAGDQVAARKPAPDVYLLALHRLGIVPSGCIAMEDSPPGHASAQAAGLRVPVTPSSYTRTEDCTAADRLLPDLTSPLPALLAGLLAGA